MYGHVIFEHRQELADGDIIEMHVWEVEPNEDYPEGIRYTMVYIRDKERLVGYDNYHGKSHHKHIREREEAYDFVDEWKVIEDFMADVGKIKEGAIK